MEKKKVYILLPDGIGLRNFAYTDFYKIGKSEEYDIIYWNNTPFDLFDLGFSEIKIKDARATSLTDIYKNVKIQSELNLNIKKTGDVVYDTYRFPFLYSNLKLAIKSIVIHSLTKFYFSQKGLNKIRKKMNLKERKTAYYRQSLATLKKEKPSIVFCTNQRPVVALAPLLAAKDLNIPTATFIYSWDNLPKATMVVETDYYFVWSDHMKKELLNYYPYIIDSQIFVTGTPQFEPHFDLDKIVSKAHFFQMYKLDINKKYICYSGDDVTTCPDDAQYLSDVATAVRQLNRDGNSLGIIFRRCPVDFSNRFDEVLEKNKDIITPIAPIWEQIGEGWNAVLPTRADLDLQINTIYHTEMVINLGSSMVFDYVTHKKPCAFINYDVKNKVLKDWSVSKIYNFVHFRSMPNNNSVLWINSADAITAIIEKGIANNSSVIEVAKQWFEIINQHPPQEASRRIWQGIKTIISKE